MFHLTLEQGHSVLTMVVVAAAAIFLAGYFYRRTYREVTPSRWRGLFALRVVAIVLVVLLLFRPVFSFEREVRQHRAVIFLVDTSASMSTADDATGTTRFDQARSRVLAWWPKLRPDFDLHLIEFSDQARPLDKPEDLLPLKPTGQATSLNRALLAAAQKVPRRDVEAAVLLTDGIQNAAGDPVGAARKLGLVVHTVGIGNSLRDSPSYRDVMVTGFECPDQLPVNNRAKVTALVDNVGFAGGVVQVLLEEGGNVLDQTELVLSDGKRPQEVSFQFVPTVKGRHTYTVRVPVIAGEKIAQNNQRSAVAVVVDARIRVLYVEGTLRAEYGALVDRFLSKDPDLEFCALVQTRPNVFAQRTNIAGLKLTGIPRDPQVIDKFNVFLLGDLDSTYLKPEQMEPLIRRVREGGAGLLMFGGYHSLGPGGYEGTPLEAILPIFVGRREIGQVTESFLPRLTPDGRQHPIFANIDKFFPGQNTVPDVAGLPPLQGCVKVTGAKPGATVLAVYPGEAGQPGAPMPVLAVHPVGKGRSAVFTGDTTRNWQQVLRGMDQESPFWRFWGQMIRWLAGRTDAIEPGLFARTDKAYYEPDAPITVLATVRGKEGDGTGQAAVTARITGPQNTNSVVALVPVPGPAGYYSGAFDPKQPGKYEIVVEARLGDTTLRTEKLTADVGRPNLEFDRLDLDDRMLSRIATETGGRYFHISTADRLMEELEHHEQRRRVYLEQPLYWPSLYWLLFVGVLTGEWLLRKRGQLR